MLQFALIWRKHDQQWAFPGGVWNPESLLFCPLLPRPPSLPDESGMVEAGQHITDSRTREFGEEAMALMDASDEAGKKASFKGVSSQY